MEEAQEIIDGIKGDELLAPLARAEFRVEEFLSDILQERNIPVGNVVQV